MVDTAPDYIIRCCHAAARCQHLTGSDAGRRRFDNRALGGEKGMQYKFNSVEIFAAHHRPDGCVEIVTSSDVRMQLVQLTRPCRQVALRYNDTGGDRRTRR